jgi:uncharacterized protein (UPF0210 family)
LKKLFFKMKIRTITIFVPCNKWDDVLPSIGLAAKMGASLQNEFVTSGYEVQTVRISMSSFEDWVRPNETVESVREVVQLLDELKIDFFNIGPAVSSEGRAHLMDLLLLSPRLSASCCCSVDIGNGMFEINETAIQDAALVTTRLGKETEGGLGNFRFCASSCMPTHVPFFPASYAQSMNMSAAEEERKQFSYAIGLESGTIAVDSLTKAAQGTEGRLPLSVVQKSLTDAFTEKLVPLQVLAKDIQERINNKASSEDYLVKYHGIDSSLNPGMGPEASVGAAFEIALGGKAFGTTGTLALASAVTKSLKSIPVQLCGYSGLMIPPLEDTTLAARQRSPPTYGITDLLAYSAVCGVGFDTVPIPGDTSVEDVAALILDTVALSVKWSKPLSCRLFPVPNKAVGEETEFNSPFLTNTGVFRVP